MLTADQVREIIREEVGAKPSRKRPVNPSRRVISLPCTVEEFAAIHAAAAERGCTAADLLRMALEPVLKRVIPQNRLIPINLAKATKRARDMNREDLASMVKAGMIARRMLEHDVGTVERQAPGVPVPKLRGPSRPE
jgi:hypothetical protein